jgi:3-phosphoshikimate 1-carboxyvinyltransferase
MRGRSIHAAQEPLKASVRAVSSKSVTHRVLVVAALASGRSAILDPLDSEDTRVTLNGLVSLGIDVRSSPGRWEIRGSGGRVPGGGEISLGESGTSLRFLTALGSLGKAPSRLDGRGRLRCRPIRGLIDALTSIGARIRESSADASLPLEVGGSVPVGGRVSVSGERSSQFASAMLLVAARLEGGLDLRIDPPAVSLPYVKLTADVLHEFGVQVSSPGPLSWRVRPGEYRGREYRVEGDHSAASYFLAAPAIVGGSVRVDGLDPDSAQPDARLSRILQRVGCRVERGRGWIRVNGEGRIGPFDLELADCPDLVPTLSVLALFAAGPCVMRGVAHLRWKESDRIEALVKNLTAFGARVAVSGDAIRITPPSGKRPGEVLVETSSDHRIAMAFAVAGLRLPGVTLDDAECVSKSNPTFWRDFLRLQGKT